MKIRAIKDLVNARLAGEQLTYSTLRPYLDAVVDDINSKLHSKFKTFSEVSLLDIDVEFNDSENPIPDKYIRTVIAVGAAAKWYIDDEEGIETATALVQQYNNNLFIMMRDFGPLVPPEFQASEATGYIPNPCAADASGINPNIRYIEMPGPKGTSVENAWTELKEDGYHLFIRFVDYQNATWVKDCGIVANNIVTIKLNAKGELVALMSDGTVHNIGHIANFMHQYLQVSTTGPLASSAGTNTIGFEIEDL